MPPTSDSSLYDALAVDDEGAEVAPEDDMGDDMAAAETQAAADLLDALASKDTAGLTSAFKRMVELCGGYTSTDE